MLLIIGRFHAHKKEKQMVSLLSIMFQNALFLHWSEEFDLKLIRHKDVGNSDSNADDLNL